MHSYGLGTTAWITFFKVFPEFAKHFRCIAMDLPNFAKLGVRDRTRAVLKALERGLI